MMEKREARGEKAALQMLRPQLVPVRRKRRFRTGPIQKECTMSMVQRSSNREGPGNRAVQSFGSPGSGEEIEGESDHRIANNLQLLMAMVAAEKRELADPAAGLVFDRMLGRIGAIAGVHRQLTRPQQTGFVDAGGYLRTLVNQIETGCCDVAGGRRLTVSADPVSVPARLAGAMGLIVSECVLNACKYAYPAQRPGEVRIELRLAGPHALRLSVEDDGTGRSQDEGGSGGFGTHLMEALAARIEATLFRENLRPGTRIVLAVPLA
jgi:two-component sensor histidine kinase